MKKVSIFFSALFSLGLFAEVPVDAQIPEVSKTHERSKIDPEHATLAAQAFMDFLKKRAEVSGKKAQESVLEHETYLGMHNAFPTVWESMKATLIPGSKSYMGKNSDEAPIADADKPADSNLE